MENEHMRQYPHRGSLFMTEVPETQKTPINYSTQETRQIVEMMSSDKALECPKCGDMLNDISTVTPPGNQDRLTVINCHSCNRMAFLRDA